MPCKRKDFSILEESSSEDEVVMLDSGRGVKKQKVSTCSATKVKGKSKKSSSSTHVTETSGSGERGLTTKDLPTIIAEVVKAFKELPRDVDTAIGAHSEPSL